jgi:hypothetical protein
MSKGQPGPLPSRFLSRFASSSGAIAAVGHERSPWCSPTHRAIPMGGLAVLRQEYTMPVTRGQWKHCSPDREKAGARPDVCAEARSGTTPGMSLSAASEPGSWRMGGYREGYEEACPNLRGALRGLHRRASAAGTGGEQTIKIRE